MSRRRPLLAVMALLVLVAVRPAAAAGGLERLFGVWVGYATVYDAAGREVERRELDVVIRRFARRGFRIRWTSLRLVGGRRDVPGVVWRESAVAFVPAQRGGYFVEAPRFDPFRRRPRDEEPVEGRPLRWAVAEDHGLFVYSFQILEDGRFELQHYRRWLEAGRLRLRYERIVDGRVVKRIEGSAIRVAGPEP